MSYEEIIKTTINDTEKITLQYCINLLKRLGYEDGLAAIEERLAKEQS
jgi:hypothetical protein